MCVYSSFLLLQSGRITRFCRLNCLWNKKLKWYDSKSTSSAKRQNTFPIFPIMWHKLPCGRVGGLVQSIIPAATYTCAYCQHAATGRTSVKPQSHHKAIQATCTARWPAVASFSLNAAKFPQSHGDVRPQASLCHSSPTGPWKPDG